MKPGRAVIALGSVVAGCGSPWTVTEEDGLVHLALTGRTGSAGRLDVRVPVAGDTSLLATFRPQQEGANAFVERLTDPDRAVRLESTDWQNSSINRTNAVFSSTSPTLAWPIDPADGPLTDGVWRLRAAAQFRNMPMDVDVAFKVDDDLSRGALAVDLAIFADVVQDAELSRGLDIAVSRWADLVYAGFGLELALSPRELPRTGGVSAPGLDSDDDALFEALSGERPLREITVVVSTAVEGLSGLLGVSGGIPGALVAAPRSVVVVSAAEAAGRDGVFSPEEVAIFSETLAHEVGHYLGLFHPVELPRDGSDTVPSEDNLDDTPSCGQLTACVSDLANNLMFPTPLCAEATAEGDACVRFVRQDELSPSQLRVVHRHVVVD